MAATATATGESAGRGGLRDRVGGCGFGESGGMVAKFGERGMASVVATVI